jgi:group I intron endonuclease
VTKKHHWTGEADPSKYYGFVYLITNTVTGRKYIGRKFYHTYKKRIRIRQSNWRVYTGSCKPLLEDIKRLGKDKFTFEIICNYKTRGGVVSGEVHFQTDNDVLSPELLPCGDRLYYNGHIGSVKFITREFHSAETRAKISASQAGEKNSYYGKSHSAETRAKMSVAKEGEKHPNYKGPYIITFEDGHTEEWQKLKNIDGYDDGALYKVLNGFYKHYKDIVKIERISPDDE